MALPFRPRQGWEKLQGEMLDEEEPLPPDEANDPPERHKFFDPDKEKPTYTFSEPDEEGKAMWERVRERALSNMAKDAGDSDPQMDMGSKPRTVRPFSGVHQDPGSPEDLADQELGQGKYGPLGPSLADARDVRPSEPFDPHRHPSDPGIEQSDEDLTKDLSRNRLARLRQDTGQGPRPAHIRADTVPGRSPATDKAQALLAKLQGKPELNPTAADKWTTNPEEGPSQTGAFPPIRSSLMATSGTGAGDRKLTPPVRENGERNALADAQARARNADREAQYARGMGQAADIISGTRYNEHAGEDIRAAGQRGVDDVLSQEAQAQQKLNEGRAREDQDFQRQGEQRAQGLDEDRKTTFGNTQKKFADDQESDTAGHPRAIRLFNAAKALYPAETKTIDGSSLSEKDVKVLLGELAQQKATGTGGGGAKGKNPLALSKLLPPETANVYAGTQRIKELVGKGGGWDKVGGVGLLQGKMPTWVPESLGGLNENESALRSEIGNLAATHLQSKGGKAITSAEDKIILGKIAANPNAATPQQLQQAMTIIERNTAGNARQGLAVLPEDQRQMILENAGVPNDWVHQSATAPTRQSVAPPKKLVRLKSGEEVEQVD